MQPLGHLQPCPLHCDGCDKAQHDAQTAEHCEHHGVDGLVEGALLGLAENEAGSCGGAGGVHAQPSPHPSPGTGAAGHTWLREQFLDMGLRIRALSVHLASQ